jgi:hypothetical protein
LILLVLDTVKSPYPSGERRTSGAKALISSSPVRHG